MQKQSKNWPGVQYPLKGQSNRNIHLQKLDKVKLRKNTLAAKSQTKQQKPLLKGNIHTIISTFDFLATH